MDKCITQVDCEKRYGVIIADCPWRYSNRGLNGSAEKHYRTMTVSELCELDVACRALDGSVTS